MLLIFDRIKVAGNLRCVEMVGQHSVFNQFRHIIEQHSDSLTAQYAAACSRQPD